MDNKDMSAGEKLMDSLKYDLKNGWEIISEDEKKKVFDFSEDYKNFLNNAKTERESVLEAIKAAEEKGFACLDEIIKSGKALKAGDKIYRVNRGKGILLAVIGKKDIVDGVNMVGAHIDAPRLDLKPNPLYEDLGMALFKTHYYGGIKKYQWTTLPLALHGVIIKKNGEKVNIVIGEDESDPVLYISDLLPHLAKEQMQKKMSEGVSAEALNVLLGSIPYKDDKVKDKVKLNILNILNEKYGIQEEDFLSAEIEVVPAFKSKDVGLDRSMVGSYGHDDRVCGYTALRGVLDINSCERTAICLLVDKEEIGSMGNTGMQSTFFQNTLAELINLTCENYNELMLKRTLSNSKCLSADVSALIDPSYQEFNDKNNSSFINKGIVICKYTGARGKSGASDASAEFVGEIRKLFNDNDVLWQAGEMGKVDMGGGGTIAQFVANLGIDVLDCGVGLLSMHAPYEIASKLDIYMAYKAYFSFMNN